MFDWNLDWGDPVRLTLATDARLGTPDYCDDQIWELRLRSGEPPGLSLHTTYGLRARNMRLFPRFTEGDHSIYDPVDFSSRPIVHRCFPNYVLVTFSPLPGIDVIHEIWVPQNYCISGRFRILNNGVTPRKLRFDWVALLSPQADGVRFTPTKVDAVTILQGESGGLAPVIFITGGPQASSSPHPNLSLDIDLLPGTDYKTVWVQAARPNKQESFELAREISFRNWDAETAHIELTNSSQVEIQTGNPDWDLAFAWAQKVALGLVHGPTDHLPHASFVLTRHPDQGHSLRGDGSDYSHLWNGQTAFDSWYLSTIILPVAPHLVMGFLRNLLAIQTQDGYVDWKPGLGGQRSRMDATPLLADLALRIFQVTQDLVFLKEVFPELLTFVFSWFSPYHDRDGDGIPEWDHPMQTGFEDHPTFSSWQPGFLGMDITAIESPALCALLYRECQALIQIAQLLDQSQPIAPLKSIADNLFTAVESTWDDKLNIYRFWDRDTHHFDPGETMAEHHGEGILELMQTFRRAVRPLIRIELDGELPRRPHMTLIGLDRNGEGVVEKIPPERFRWNQNVGMATSEQVFSRIEHFQIQDIDPSDTVHLLSADFTTLDHSLLLPLWAEIPEKGRARTMVKHQIDRPDAFHRPYGIPACPEPSPEVRSDPCHAVWLNWNTLIGEGLLAYGERRKAADLVTRLMGAIVKTLKADSGFRRHYHAESGLGIGERDILSGLAPVGLFLKTLGVRLYSPWRVGLEGHNPFRWPVRVKYRGLTIERKRRSTTVSFPNGRTVEIRSAKACIVDGRSDD